MTRAKTKRGADSCDVLAPDAGIRVTRVGAAGRGVVATRAFAAGDLLFRCSGRIVSERTRYTIQLDVGRHLDASDACRCLNHACEPSATLRLEEDGMPGVYALRPLAPGDEVTVDYATFETRPGFVGGLACGCGAASCRGRIVGWDDLTDAERDRLRDRALPYLRDRRPTSAPARPPRPSARSRR